MYLDNKILVAWLKFNCSMDKSSHAQWHVGSSYLSISLVAQLKVQNLSHSLLGVWLPIHGIRDWEHGH